MADRYLPLDEEGYFNFDGRRVDDEELGAKLLANLDPKDKDRFETNIDGNPAWVEYFDEPLIAKHVRASARPGFGTIDLPYRATAEFSLKTLSVDEWDRFHGVTEKQIPFVFSRQAQFEFFDMLDSFDDDSITVKGERYEIPPWLIPTDQIGKHEFWTDIYKNENPGWDLGHESVILGAILPQLKLNKSRVLVLGAGAGHDAACFARQGHVVTAVDFSPKAVARARKTYGSFENLKIMQADAFQLPQEMNGKFDLVFEHTCFCAISPERRNDLVRVWKRMLAPRGHLLGIFFVHNKRVGPPFGGSEWELRERLKSHFNFLFWTRWRHSQENRKARELVVYAQRK